ncbi:hypothetical protein ERS069936_00995 [Streptococcus pneumoniae]|nr:hypothetical protein ERS069936_00995 [Streptococcus pneumoniae]
MVFRFGVNNWGYIMKIEKKLVFYLFLEKKLTFFTDFRYSFGFSELE